MANSLHAPTVPCPQALYISGLSVDFSESAKIFKVESAEVRFGQVHTPVQRAAGRTLRQTFFPPIKLSLGVLFSLHLRHNGTRFGLKTVEDIQFDTEEIFRVSGASGESKTREYIKFHKKFKIVVELSGNTAIERAAQPVSESSSSENPGLPPTTDEIIRICPRFRILVIGKTGVGKSSLINHAFGVDEALTSHDKPGEAHIDTEFISHQNDRFVLHDSKGFEPGGEGNLKTVQDFIDRRRSQPALKDQLHAIWLCFEIPRAGGRLLESGTEAFLELKRDGKLGNIPVVVVLTKYDMLIDRVDRILDDSSLEGFSDDAIKKLIKSKADAELQDICIGPLEKFAGPDIPHTAISTKECHKKTLAPLIQMTENLVRQHLAPEASLMTCMAQRVDPELNIKASIEVGKRRYWKALASSTAFRDHTTRDCLNVLHTDIVAVWQFHDPHRYLYSPEFRTLMVNMVDTLDDGPTVDPNSTVVVGLSMVGTIAGIVAALAAPAAPIVVPIAASVVLAMWVHDVYKMSHAVLRRFMCYIIDLTLVLQTLYLVSESQELSRRAIKLAVASYLASPVSGEVHTRIQEYDRGLALLERADRDTLDKITELMQLYSIGAETISELRAQIPAMGLFPDEPWEDKKAS